MSSGDVLGLLAKLYNDKQNLACTYETLTHHTTIKLNVRSSKTCNFGALDSIYLMTLKTTATLIFFPEAQSNDMKSAAYCRRLYMEAAVTVIFVSTLLSPITEGS